MREDIPGFDHRVGGGSVPALESDITLTLPARPENIALVRHMIGALADRLEIDHAPQKGSRLLMAFLRRRGGQPAMGAV
jgi:hypothetical protein